MSHFLVSEFRASVGRSFNASSVAPNILWISGLIFGLAVRAAGFFYSDTLEIDESALLMNILERDWLQLLAPLDYNQHAPIGYLLCVKLATMLGGESYLTLRICNYSLSSLSIIIFATYVRKLFPLSVAALLTWILAVSPEAILYSVVAKQYAFDLGLTSILLVLCAPRLLAEDVSTLKFPFVLAVLGAVFVWFSHPIIFVLIGYLSATAFGWFQRPNSNWRGIIVLGAIWSGSWLLNYSLVLRQSSGNQFLRSFWHSYFAPFPPFSTAELKWYLDRFLDLFFVGPFSFSVSGAVMVLVVCLGIARLFDLNKSLLIFLCVPILCALGASMFTLYPFYNRFLLFSMPLLLVLFGFGFELLIRLPLYGTTCASFVYLLLLVFPVASSAKILLNGFKNSYPKNMVVESLEKNVTTNDLVFASNGIINRLRIYYYLRHDAVRMKSFSYLPAASSLAPAVEGQTWLLLENREEDLASQVNEIKKYHRLDEVAKFNGERAIGLYRLLR